MWAATAAATVASLTLAACGGGGNTTPTTRNATSVQPLDPATKVPADVTAYAVITVKPEGTLKADLVSSIDKLAGAGAAERLAANFTKASPGNSSIKDFKDIAGGRIGVALTGIPSSASSQNLSDHFMVVVPTASPSAARRFAAANPAGRGEIKRTVGNFVIVGGATAVHSIVTSDADSLAEDSTYTSAVAQLGNSDQVATVFVRARRLYQALAKALAKGLGRVVPAASQAFTRETAKLGPSSTLTIGLGAAKNTFRLDLVQQGFPKTGGSPSEAGDVGSLPGDSWLAVSANLNSRSVRQMTAMLPSMLAQQRAAGSSAQGELQGLLRNIIPALGPMTLSVAGTSVGGLQAGVTLTPLNAAAGANLFTVLKQTLKHVPVLTSQVGKQIIVSFGYADPRDLLSPSSRLSGNPIYESALAQLPPGSHVPIYLNFAGLSTFLAAADKSRQDVRVWRVARKLSYLIVGSAGSRTSLVLGLK